MSGAVRDIPAVPEGERRWEMPCLFDAAHERSAEHVSDLAEIATLFEQSSLFLMREHSGSGETAPYRLRGSGLVVVIRHGSRDLGVVDEVFRRRFYELPGPVARMLDSLGRPPVAVDLGGHIGLFAVWLAERYPEARITAFEPDRFNFALLERCVRANVGRLSCDLVHAAAATSPGTVPFVDGDFASSRIASAAEAANGTVDQVDALPALAGADLLKADLEGGEWAVLADPRLATSAVRAIALEYHPHLCPRREPREEAQRLLANAGFRSTELLFERPDGVGMLWAWRTPA